MKTKRQTKIWFKQYMRLLKFRILHANDSPHRIALGAAIGLFVAWTPVYGFHILLAFLLAILTKANKFTALVFIWVNNAFTVIVIYYSSYLVGRMVLKIFRPERLLSNADIAKRFSEHFPINTIFVDIFTVRFWRDLFWFFLELGMELWVGTFIVGAIVATVGYFLVRYLVILYRSKNPRRRFLSF